MKIGTLSTTNSKGQVVIPAHIRKQLRITEEVLLHITLKDDGIYIAPVKDIITGHSDDSVYKEIVKKTQGAWGAKTVSEKKSDQAQRTLELAATQKAKALW